MNNMRARKNTILIADDDADDRRMAKEALEEAKVVRDKDIHFVENGEELMDYLHRRGKYAEPAVAPRPGLILLDLNMPKKDGRQALKEIKSDPRLRNIPLVIMTTSKADEDILRSYDCGGNSFITKPVSYSSMVDLMKNVTDYWFNIVELPQRPWREQRNGTKNA